MRRYRWALVAAAVVLLITGYLVVAHPSTHPTAAQAHFADPPTVAGSATEPARSPSGSPSPGATPTKAALQSKLADKMAAVLRPEEIGRLARRKQGVVRAEIGCRFEDRKRDLGFHLTT